MKAPALPLSFQPRMSPSPYTLPDFGQPPFAGAPEARFEPLPADGVLPEGFFSTSNLPTYVHVDGRWLAPTAAAHGLRDRASGRTVLETIEPRRLRKGELVAMGEAEDGTRGHRGATPRASSAVPTAPTSSASCPPR